jgi:hypothetical protein
MIRKLAITTLISIYIDRVIRKLAITTAALSISTDDTRKV